ncbi:MAG: bifunctional diaminohydroxyphosphoribosylaminopyrimidine deaminase/5-amino-6-(5-phosphoribosylamino)uracil reductase RibD [Devosiaceae bacterium]|nr:bifunctional diaminohydroxyphosphoribosylaminopyrimidine deaminase/5-amino-6-(5-phosphoribosylamino)uracil reductase RibD [Devosiaceae bacterium MH13]
MTEGNAATELLDDRRYLAASIRLGRSRLGRTWPNPSVGCILVRDGVVVGAGVTGDSGMPHGEVNALTAAGEAAKGATAYVSLEPCNHHGRTPPCTEAMMAAGVSRVVIALSDPDPRVSSTGAQRLRDAGLAVDEEPFADLRQTALRAHRGHIARMERNRPHVTLKLALSQDGAIGVQGEGQVPITGAQANALMHGLRARVDAIAVGAGTWAIDVPKLTVRLPGLAHRSPQRVVFGGDELAGLESMRGVWHLTGHDLRSHLRVLAGSGIGRLLVEGGATIARALVDDGLVDELVLLQGPGEIGAKGVFPFAANPLNDLAGAGLAGWRATDQRDLGEDRMVVFTPPPSLAA